MTLRQRIQTILSSLVMLFAAALISLDPELGWMLIMLILACTAICRGIGKLTYYLSMTRHMVGGRSILYQGVFYLDFGLFTLEFASFPPRYIMIYLLITYLFYGLIDVMRANEIRKRSMGSWKFKLLVGLGNIAVGLFCLTQLDSMDTAVYIYSIGMAWSAICKLISAFRKTAVLYVQQA